MSLSITELDKPKYSVLVVCLGNICRSPLAYSVFHSRLTNRNLLSSFLLEGRGTEYYARHGARADERSVSIAKKHKIKDLSGHRSQQLTTEDCARFQWILCMDHSNVENAKRIATSKYAHRVHLYRPNGEPVEDPYYDDISAFERTYQLLTSHVDEWIDRIIGSKIEPTISKVQTIDKFFSTKSMKNNNNRATEEKNEVIDIE